MKITLRRANALQESIQEHIKTIEVKTQIELNEFHSVDNELENARAAVFSSDSRRENLTRALYQIRASVGRANASSGVSDLLSDAAYVDRRIGQLKSMLESKATEDISIVRGKLQKLEDAGKTNRMYGFNDTVSVGVLNQSSLDAYKSKMLELRKQKQKINDQVLELNVRTEIVLDKDIVTLLQTEQLL